MALGNNVDIINKLAEQAVELGANKASVLPVDQIIFDASLRKACEANYCGNYGKNWTCPPSVGNIDELIANAKTFQLALVYQTVSKLEDSFDFEGMAEALKRHREVTDLITAAIRQQTDTDMLQLSAGGCVICDTCAKREEKPCRFPDRAVASLEAYGIFVTNLAEKSNMNYINGKNTVTYFGAYLFK